MKIKFLTLTPQQFAEGPATSNLLSQAEKFSILMNISSPSTDVAMPAGFSTSTVPRQRVKDSLYTVNHAVISWRIIRFIILFFSGEFNGYFKDVDDNFLQSTW